jgi:hypothetical protein
LEEKKKKQSNIYGISGKGKEEERGGGGGRKGGKLFQVERFVRLEKTRTLLRETSARTRRRGKKSVVGIIGIARRRRRKRVDAIDVYFHFLDVNTFEV